MQREIGGSEPGAAGVRRRGFRTVEDPAPLGAAAVMEGVEDLVERMIRITGVRTEVQQGIFHGTGRAGAAGAFDEIVLFRSPADWAGLPYALALELRSLTPGRKALARATFLLFPLSLLPWLA